MGGDASSSKNDLWQYNPTTNLWTQQASFPVQHELILQHLP
jgi:hypothetical protein